MKKQNQKNNKRINVHMKAAPMLLAPPITLLLWTLVYQHSLFSTF